MKPRNRGIWNKRFVQRLMQEYISGEFNRDQLLWALLMFELWCREYFGQQAGIGFIRQTRFLLIAQPHQPSLADGPLDHD